MDYRSRINCLNLTAFFALFVFLLCRMTNGTFTIESSTPTLRINLNESDTNFRTTIPITLQLPSVPLYNGTINNYYSIDPDVLGDKKKNYSRNVMDVDCTSPQSWIGDLSLSWHYQQK
jgi:hypothetical protein